MGNLKVSENYVTILERDLKERGLLSQRSVPLWASCCQCAITLCCARRYETVLSVGGHYENENTPFLCLKMSLNG